MTRPVWILAVVCASAYYRTNESVCQPEDRETAGCATAGPPGTCDRAPIPYQHAARIHGAFNAVSARSTHHLGVCSARLRASLVDRGSNASIAVETCNGTYGDPSYPSTMQDRFVSNGGNHQCHPSIRVVSSFETRVQAGAGPLASCGKDDLVVQWLRHAQSEAKRLVHGFTVKDKNKGNKHDNKHKHSHHCKYHCKPHGHVHDHHKHHCKCHCHGHCHRKRHCKCPCHDHHQRRHRSHCPDHHSRKHTCHCRHHDHHTLRCPQHWRRHCHDHDRRRCRLGCRGRHCNNRCHHKKHRHSRRCSTCRSCKKVAVCRKRGRKSSNKL